MPSDYQRITKENESRLGTDTASRRTQVSMYADPAHFVYEILQNADDKGATEVDFSMTPEGLVIIHDGTPFSEKDVEGITYFGKSQSRDDHRLTGRFGVGFKSVFAYTAAPRISSGEESFEIYGLYRAREWPRPKDLGADKTRIELPFNHFEELPDYVEKEDWKTPEQACERVGRRLKEELLPTTLLFTEHLRKLTWSSEGGSGSYIRDDQEFGEGRRSEIRSGEGRRKYLVFSRPIEYESEEHKPIEIAFPLNEDGTSVRSADSGERFISVLFPTEVDPSLRFILNGPFRTTPNRENIGIDSRFNQMLLEQAGELLPPALLDIRDQGLLDDMSFLEVLPNSSDELDEFYGPLKSAALRAFRSDALVPAENKGEHVEIRGAFFAPAHLREIIGPDELGFFLGRESDVKWTAGVRPNSRHERLLLDLGIERYSWRTLGQQLTVYFEGRVPDVAKAWLGSRSDEWLKKFYMHLATAVEQRECGVDVGSCKIMRASSGGITTHMSFQNAYFAKRGFPELWQVPRDWAIEGSKKAESLRDALSILGVTEIGEREAVEKILDRFYGPEATEEASESQHLRHMEKFIEGLSERDLTLRDFLNHRIFRTASGYRTARDCYLDEPIEPTGLDALVKHEHCPESFKKLRLSSWYHGMGGIAEFCSELGVLKRLPIEKQRIPYSHPNYDELVYHYGRQTQYYVNKDFYIPSLAELLSIEDPEINRLIWKATLQEGYPYYNDQYRARFRRNDSAADNQRYATWVLELRDAVWIPDEGGVLHKPSEVAEDNIHASFRQDSDKQTVEQNKRYYQVIRLGADVQADKEEEREKEAAVKAAGIDPEAARTLAKLSPEKQRNWARKIDAEEQQAHGADPTGGGSGKRSVDAPPYHEAFKNALARRSTGQSGASGVPAGAGTSPNPGRRREKSREQIESSRNEEAGGKNAVSSS